jgi:hypothetical protein
MHSVGVPVLNVWSQNDSGDIKPCSSGVVVVEDGCFVVVGVVFGSEVVMVGDVNDGDVVEELRVRPDAASVCPHAEDNSSGNKTATLAKRAPLPGVLSPRRWRAPPAPAPS